MSYIIYTKESIKIKAINVATREILNKIIEQIRCLTDGEGITYGALSYIKLTINGHSVTEKYDWERSFGEEPIFKEDSDLMCLLNTNNITELELLLDYFAELHGDSYGSVFMDELCKEHDKSALANLEYKVLEYYDFDTDFTACKLCDGELVFIEPNADVADISGVMEWFSDDFSLGVSSDDDLDEEVAKKARQLAAEFGEKYDLDDCQFVFWEEAIFFSNSFGIDHASIPELIKYIDKYARFAKENNLNLVLDGVFTPFDDIPKFAYFTFSNDENGTKINIAQF